jgi:hypothetical protein
LERAGERVESYLTGKDFAAERARTAGPRTFGRDKWHNFDDYDVHVMTDTEKEQEIKFWEDYMGPTEMLNDNGYNLLLSVARQVSSSGAKLVLIDLPLPPWHINRVAYEHLYRLRFAPYINQMSTLPGFYYGNIREGFNDDDFHDSAHARPKVTERWAERVSHTILTAIGK